MDEGFEPFGSQSFKRLTLLLLCDHPLEISENWVGHGCPEGNDADSSYSLPEVLSSMDRSEGLGSLTVWQTE